MNRSGHFAGLADAKVGAPMRFDDDLGIDVRVVTGTAPNARHDAGPVAMLRAFHRGSGRVDVVEAPEAAMLTALPAAPEIRGITWRAEDIGGGGIIDRSRATLVLGVDGGVSGNASCNACSGRYRLDGAVQRVELLPTGALLVFGPDRQSLRFFPETSR